MKTKEEIGKELSIYLTEKGYTQRQIAEELHTSQPFVNALMNGKKPFGKKAAAQWAEKFGISAAWLLTGEGKMIPDADKENISISDNSETEIESNETSISENDTTEIKELKAQIALLKTELAQAHRTNDSLLEILKADAETRATTKAPSITTLETNA